MSKQMKLTEDDNYVSDPYDVRKCIADMKKDMEIMSCKNIDAHISISNHTTKCPLPDISTQYTTDSTGVHTTHTKLLSMLFT